MNKDNERLMAFINMMRKLPRWALILISVGVVVILGIAMFLLLPQPTTSQGNSTYINSTGLAFSVFLKLGAVVLLIIGLAIVLKRWQTKNSITHSKQITILETAHLSQRQALYLIEIENQKLLIGATDQSINLLHAIGNKDENKNFAANDAGSSFSELLTKASNSMEHPEE